MQHTTKVRHMVLMALYTAISLTLFVAEAQIPFTPMIPGIKLGLSNIMTLIIITRYTKKDALTVMIIKIILGSLFSGQIMGLIYSLAGGVLCFSAMSISSWALRKNYLWFTSILGAVFHNTGQILAAAAVFRSWSVIYYYPFLIISAVITGLATGITASCILKRLKKPDECAASDQ
ncbi:MAG: Gx transporter family protein [Oscillospiraceae bacterium]|nr:Gx transporter family protein [Oscillospiraceae bacterium]